MMKLTQKLLYVFLLISVCCCVAAVGSANATTNNKRSSGEEDSSEPNDFDYEEFDAQSLPPPPPPPPPPPGFYDEERIPQVLPILPLPEPDYSAPATSPIHYQVEQPGYHQHATSYAQPQVQHQQAPQNNYEQNNYQKPPTNYQHQQQPQYPQPPQPPQHLQHSQQSQYSQQPLPHVGTKYVPKNAILTYPPALYESYSLNIKPQVHQSPISHIVPNYAKHCPKSYFTGQPSQKDIEQAFIYANNQLGLVKNQSVHYLTVTGSQGDWAIKNQLFARLANPGVKSDEDGLVNEYASLYISQRLCMNKWERQRYLPSLKKIVSNGNYPASHPCRSLRHGYNLQGCHNARYRNYDGFCNNPWHPYWGKSDVCHIRILSPDYSDGISAPRVSNVPGIDLPNPRDLSNWIHNDVSALSPYNQMKMQWGQFINHDITNTALSSYEGLVDCCRNPNVQGCFPIAVPKYDPFFSKFNVTCLNFVRSAVCPVCELGPRQQQNKNTAFIDASHVYGSNLQQHNDVRLYRNGRLKSYILRTGEEILPLGNLKNGSPDEICGSNCFVAGDARVNQHPTLTALHILALRRHNQHAYHLSRRHPNWNDETLFQEARRLLIAEYQMITYNEYLPIVFGPFLSAYYKLRPLQSNYTYFEQNTDPTTWNEYSTASCRFGHSQISRNFFMSPYVVPEGREHELNKPGLVLPLRDWFSRGSVILEGQTSALVNGLLSSKSQAVDQWVVDDVRNFLQKSMREKFGGDLPATNIQRGRDNGIAGYVHYLDYCFHIRVKDWKDLQQFFEPHVLNQLRDFYKVVENIDLFTGGLSEKHAPGADTGPTFACINGIQYYHLKFGDRYYFEHANQPAPFSPQQLTEIRRTTLARFLCKTANIKAAPVYAFVNASPKNPLVDCRHVPDINYHHF